MHVYTVSLCVCVYLCGSTGQSFLGSPLYRDSELSFVNFYNPLDEGSVRHRASTYTG
jgi:hypothetical protein